MTRPKISIIVVSFNTRNMTIEALSSVFKYCLSEPFEIIVVDNASADGSADAIHAEFGARVNLIRSFENIGFAAANNLAAKQALGEYLLLLNPDTIVLDHAIGKLLNFAEKNPNYGIYGGRTVFLDGSLNIASCWSMMTPWSLFCSALGLTAAFPRSKFFDHEAMGSWKRDSVREVDIVVGCFLLIRRQLWETLGGFNLKYWMYGEEADLCLRAKKLGFKAVITPEATIVHYVGAATGASDRKTPLVAKAKSTLIRDHWNGACRMWGLYMMWQWAATRYAAARALNGLMPKRFAKAYQTWRTVWEARHDWLAGY